MLDDEGMSDFFAKTGIGFQSTKVMAASKVGQPANPLRSQTEQSRPEAAHAHCCWQSWLCCRLSRELGVCLRRVLLVVVVSGAEPGDP